MSWGFRWGFGIGAAVAIFTLPVLQHAIDNLPARDDEALGRRMADLLHLKDLAVVLVSPLGMWLQHLLLALKLALSLGVGHSIIAFGIRPAVRRRAALLKLAVQPPLLGLMVTAAVIFGTLHVLVRAPTAESVKLRVAALGAAYPSSPRTLHASEPLDSDIALYLSAISGLYMAALRNATSQLSEGPTIAIAGLPADDPLEQLQQHVSLALGLALLTLSMPGGGGLRLRRVSQALTRLLPRSLLRLLLLAHHVAFVVLALTPSWELLSLSYSFVQHVPLPSSAHQHRAQKPSLSTSSSRPLTADA